MMNGGIRPVLASGTVGLFLLCGCVGGPAARSGAAVGGLTGGAIGAAAGSPGGQSLEGAAIGALAGSALGGAVGDAADRQWAAAEARQVAWEQEQRARAVTLDQVIQLTQSGIGDQVIANQIRSQGVIAPLSTADLVLLKQNGVSDAVITAWQQAPPANQLPVRVVQPAPAGAVVIRERWVQPTWGPGCYWYGPRSRYRGSGASLHFRF